MGRQPSYRIALLLASLLSLGIALPAAAASLPGPIIQLAPRAAVQQVRYYFVSCVPYARMRSGIDLPGNAWQWWGNAAGRYERGQTPEPGAVLAFRAIRRMPLGHVAVVSRVINAREILVDQANWMPPGVIVRGTPVVDVSPENDWTEVRVGIGGGHFGSEYPTYGFIYRSRPGEVRTEVATNLPLPPVEPGHGSLDAGAASNHVEVAEAPADVSLGSSLVTGGFRLDAPDHRLR